MIKRVFCFLLSINTLFSVAQKKLDRSYYLPESVTYNSKIPTPESVLGYPVGKWHVSHDKLVAYLALLANHSDRITLENRGVTFEDRPLLLLTITSPQNHSNLEQIRQDHFALTTSNAETKNTDKMPAVVYQGFSIHGNEPSGANAALLLAYYLAAAEGDEINNILNNTIILLDPCMNPDGTQRFANWVNVHKSEHLISDSNDREFDENWPKGRTNHYWFDMNRDWLPTQLPESQARVQTFHKWKPNILTDHHEMGTNATFFFQPGIPSRTHPLTPKKNQQLTKEIALFHSEAFDKIGSLYYTEESFDDFYYGKGSTFPDINGGIGILFEQASARGHLQESDHGLLSFPFAIRNQFTAALSTLAAAKEKRVALLNYQRTFYKNARKEASQSSIKSIVFGDEKDAAKTNAFVAMLLRQKIDVHHLKNDFTHLNTKYTKGASYAIPMNQKQHRLINAMFEKRTSFQDSLFYDVSAWTLPLAYNITYDKLKNTSVIGEKINNEISSIGTVTSKSSYAYLFPWNSYYAPKVLAKLLSKNIIVKVAMKPFTLKEKFYDYGTLMIPVTSQNIDQDTLFKLVSELAKDAAIAIDGVTTGLTEGIDLGSNNFKRIHKQKIAMLVGEGITSYDAGEIWHLFDQRYETPLTKLDTRNFNTTNLSKYTTIILPNTRGLSEDAKSKLKKWVQQGGTLIAYRNAVKWLHKNNFIKLNIKSPEVNSNNVAFKDKGNHFGAQVIGGAIFETKLDRSHPIAFGYQNNSLPMFRNTTVFLEADEKQYNNPIQYTENPLLSGYISKENLAELKNSVPFKVQRKGYGKVLVFTDNTNFRAFWYGTNKLLMNAIYFADFM